MLLGRLVLLAEGVGCGDDDDPSPCWSSAFLPLLWWEGVLLRRPTVGVVSREEGMALCAIRSSCHVRTGRPRGRGTCACVSRA